MFINSDFDLGFGLLQHLSTTLSSFFTSALLEKSSTVTAVLVKTAWWWCCHLSRPMEGLRISPATFMEQPNRTVQVQAGGGAQKYSAGSSPMPAAIRCGRRQKNLLRRRRAEEIDPKESGPASDWAGVPVFGWAVKDSTAWFKRPNGPRVIASRQGNGTRNKKIKRTEKKTQGGSV